MEASVESVVGRLLEAWNRGDAQAFGELFTSDADYVTAAGDWRKGREAIRQLLAVEAVPPHVQVEGSVSVRDHGEVRTVGFGWAALGETGPAGGASLRA